jgi:integrase
MVDLFDFDPGRLIVKTAIVNFKAYLQRLTCHQLRHTFARRLAEQHMPVDSLAKLLGHNDLQTTQLYIDGAAPTVRQDFEQAMQGLIDRPGSGQPTASLAPGALPAAAPAPQERPDHEVVLE